MGVLISSSLESFIQLIGVLIIFIFVLVLTYFTTKWMGNVQSRRLNSKNLRLIETISIGNGKMISLVEAGKVYLVVSVGKEEIHLLTSLSQEELKDTSFLEKMDSEIATDSFQEILAKLKEKIPKK